MVIMHAWGSAGLISFDDGGYSGLPVMFVHSLGGNSKQWSSQLDHLRRSRRAIALDLRGHGLSQMPEDGDYAVESLADDIDSVVKELRLHRFVLVGHSLGGCVAIAYTDAHPEVVAGLLLADSCGRGPFCRWDDCKPEDVTSFHLAEPLRQVAEEEAERWKDFIGALESESYSGLIEDYYGSLLSGSRLPVQQTVIHDLRSTPRETVIGIFKSLSQHDPIPALKRYRGPKASIITRFNSSPFSLHELVADLARISMEGTGHWLQMDKPEEVNRILDEFLAQVDSA